MAFQPDAARATDSWGRRTGYDIIRFSGSVGRSGHPDCPHDCIIPIVVIRNASGDDIPAMLSLWRQFWKPQEYEANLKAKIERDPDLVLVAEADGRIIGTVIGGTDLWWSWIYRVAADQKSQRRGAGIVLLKEIGARFKARGIDSAGLIVSPENEPMLSLLGKFNFRAHKDGHYGISFQ